MTVVMVVMVVVVVVAMETAQGMFGEIGVGTHRHVVIEDI